MMTRLPALLLLAAVTAAGAKAPLVVTPSGKPQSCIPLSSIRETQVRDDRTIDFIMNGKQAYRNTLPYACPELGSERAFSYETSLSELCSTDIITVFRNSGGGPRRGASCGLGQFQPVTGLR